MTALLASVRSAGEAALALAGGADIIDLKDPQQGALGRLDSAHVRATLTLLAGRVPVSATTGDSWHDIDATSRAVEALAELGVDTVKVGLWAAGRDPAYVEMLAGHARRGIAIVAVALAESHPDPRLVAELAQADLAGVMIDTADKQRGGLCRQLPAADIAAVVQAARAERLAVGLAGSLGIDDIARLVPLRPDVLGFRGALCGAAGRAGELLPEKLREVRNGLDRALARQGNAPLAGSSATTSSRSSTGAAGPETVPATGGASDRESKLTEENA